MKNIAILTVAILVLSIISCKKSSDDPTPEDYNISYTVSSTNEVVMDTIMYMDESGNKKYLFGEANFTNSFVQPSNNYHALLFVSGSIGNIGNCEYSVKILDKDGNIVRSEKSNSNTPGTHFKWEHEFYHSEN